MEEVERYDQGSWRYDCLQLEIATVVLLNQIVKQEVIQRLHCFRNGAEYSFTKEGLKSFTHEYVLKTRASGDEFHGRALDGQVPSHDAWN